MTEEKQEVKKDLIVFLDTLGRTIIGKCVGESSTNLEVQNPAVVNIVPQQAQDPNTGQVVQRMALQLFPIFFREFLAEKNESVVFSYNKNNITMSTGDITLDYKVAIQYEQLFMVMGEIQVPQITPNKVQSQTPIQKNDNEDKVIKLFD